MADILDPKDIKLNVKQPRRSPADLHVRMFANFAGDEPLPKSVDYRDTLLPPRNQGSQGSCVAMSCAAMKESQEQKERGVREYLSPQFFYNNRSNLYDNDPRNDDGMYGNDMLQLLVKVGICREETYPYGRIETRDKIPKEVYEEAKGYVVKSYATATRAADLARSLVVNGPAVVFVPVYNYGGRMWFQEAGQQMLGGHAMCVVGYTERDEFVIRNSWGRNWNGDGHCLMSFQDFETRTWGAYTTVDFTPEEVQAQVKGFYLIRRRNVRVDAFLDRVPEALQGNRGTQIWLEGSLVVHRGEAIFQVVTGPLLTTQARQPSDAELKRRVDRKDDAGLTSKAYYTELDDITYHELRIPAVAVAHLVPVEVSSSHRTRVRLSWQGRSVRLTHFLV